MFYGESGLGKLDMAIGLASLLLGRQVFSQPKGESYLAEVKEARLANGDTENVSKPKDYLSIWIRVMPFGFAL